MIIKALPLDGLYTIEYKAFKDDRGSFKRIFCTDDCTPVLGNRSIVQINQSSNTTIGTVRGMHMQTPPSAELKIIQCIKGRVWDVAVDVRQGSDTFLQYHAIELSEQDDQAFVIPEGFAHGFQVLEPNSELLYFHSSAYAPDCGMTINPNDPIINIDWPLPISTISDKDQNQAFLDTNYTGIKL